MPRLLVIQNVPTQFDEPFYEYFNRNTRNEIVLLYTVATASAVSIDTEISIQPNWNTSGENGYLRVYERRIWAQYAKIISLRPSHIIICGWYPRNHALLALLLKITGYTIGVRSDNIIDEPKKYGFRAAAKRLFLGLWLGMYDYWHPVGTLSSDFLHETSFFLRPTRYFPYSVDIERFYKDIREFEGKREEFRVGMGLRARDYVVLGVIKWTHRENPLELIDAIRIAMESVENIKLLLVGDGPLKDDVEERCQPYESIFIRPGYIKYRDLSKFYFISDLFVHPPRRESFGVSVQEAMACGLPVITSNAVGSAVDFIVDGLNGGVYQSGCTQELADLIVRWARDSSRTSIATHAIRSASRRSYEFSASELSSLL